MTEFTPRAGAAPEPTPGPPFDEAALLDRAEGDTELLQEIVELFLDDSPRQLAAVQAAVAAADAQALTRAAHSLKGAASNFGAAAVVAAALELETMGRTGNVAGAAAVADRLAAALIALETALARLM